MILTATKVIDVFEMFRDSDKGSVLPLHLSSFCDWVNTRLQTPPDIETIFLYEDNGRLAMTYKEYYKDQSYYHFKYETVSEIVRLMPPAAVLWLHKINRLHIDLVSKDAKQAIPGARI